MGSLIGPATSRTAISFTSLLRCARGRPIAIPDSRRAYLTVYGYTQAKALVFSEHGQPKDVLHLHKHSISPASGTTLNLKLLASPINPADINQLEGVYPSKPPFTTTLGTAAPSAVAGNEGVCEVISVGNQVTNFRPGDRAIFRFPCVGTWRTHASVDETQNLLIKVPKDIPVVSAATVSVNPCTAYRMLSDFWPEHDGESDLASTGAGAGRGGGLKAAAVNSEWVIQNGANSSVGRFVIQLCKIWNLKSLNIIRRGNKSPEEISALKNELYELGANKVITDEALASKDIRTEIQSLTGDRGIALGLNCVGGKATTDMARLLRKNATVVTYGAMARQPITVPASLFIFKDLRLRGFWVSEWAKGRDAEKERMVAEIFEFMRKGWLKDGPVREVSWKEETGLEELVGEVVEAGKGSGPKRVFVFDEAL